MKKVQPSKKARVKKVVKITAMILMSNIFNYHDVIIKMIGISISWLPCSISQFFHHGHLGGLHFIFTAHFFCNCKPNMTDFEDSF